MRLLAERLKSRRLEKGITRQALAEISGVPAPTIARFEQQSAISMRQYADLCIVLGYADQLQVLMEKPVFRTMEELETINNNKNRKRGSHAKH